MSISFAIQKRRHSPRYAYIASRDKNNVQLHVKEQQGRSR